MFGLPAGQVNGIDNSSLLYSAADDILTSSLLTPDPDPKFDISGTKTDDAPFGDFNTLGIYEHYNESGPSSIQFGDGIESSEHGGSHTSTKDELAGAISGLNGVHASANWVGQLPNTVISSNHHQNVINSNMLGRHSNGQTLVLPAKAHNHTVSTPPRRDIQYDHIEVKT
jgi:hypothetical protein